jgi:hypothetical protein
LDLVSDSEEITPSEIDLDPPISHAITDGWADFAQMVLPTIGGDKDAQAHIAFHIGAIYVLQIAQHVLAERSAEEAARWECSTRSWPNS